MNPQKSNARRGFRERELEREKSRKQVASEWQPEVFPPKEEKMKNKTLRNVLVIIGTLVLIGLCLWGTIFVYKQVRSDFAPKTEIVNPTEPAVVVQPTEPAVVVQPTEPAVVVQPTEVPTAAELNSSMVNVDVPTSPVAVSDPAPTCPGWNTNPKVSQWLPSGQTAIGDVVVNGIPQYDNGSGESTIVVNMSSKDVDIFAEWGSGCEWTTDVESVVQKQLFAGCGDSNEDGIVDGCDTVRVVLVTDMGTEVTFRPVK